MNFLSVDVPSARRDVTCYVSTIQNPNRLILIFLKNKLILSKLIERL